MNIKQQVSMTDDEYSLVLNARGNVPPTLDDLQVWGGRHADRVMLIDPTLSVLLDWITPWQALSAFDEAFRSANTRLAEDGYSESELAAYRHGWLDRQSVHIVDLARARSLAVRPQTRTAL